MKTLISAKLTKENRKQLEYRLKFLKECFSFSRTYLGDNCLAYYLPVLEAVMIENLLNGFDLLPSLEPGTIKEQLGILDCVFSSSTADNISTAYKMLFERFADYFPKNADSID